MPEEFRQVVLLHYLSGLSYKEIAAFLGVPSSTVTGRLQQARLHLKETLLRDAEKEMKMAAINISEAVERDVYQIATEHVHTKIPLSAARRLVLLLRVYISILVQRMAVSQGMKT